jgi:hypothetical protein
MKLIEKWVMESINSLNTTFTVEEVRDNIISKKGNSLIIGSNTQLASYCRRHGYRIGPMTYRRKRI